MGFKINSLYLTDGYKVGHQKMLAANTSKLYGTWIPRSVKYAPKGVEKIVSFGQQLVWKWLHDEFEENFFFTEIRKSCIKEYAASETILQKHKEKALQFVKDMSLYLGMEYEGKHFEELWDLGYLPIKVKALPEGVETKPNIPHMTFVNTVDGFAWLTLYLETIVSSLAWKPSTIATIAKLYHKQAEEWALKTDKENIGLVPFMCHDFSARGLDPMSQILCGLGWSTSFLGSDTLPVIPASRYFYGVKEDEMPIYSVNASEHSVSTTKIFTVGEKQMITDWLELFPTGILSIVADTFDLWKLITEYLPANKEAIMARDGKLVIRPDSGDPVDIICGDAWRVQGFTEGVLNKVGKNGVVLNYVDNKYYKVKLDSNYKVIGEETTNVTPANKGVIELLWDIFGGTINEQGYKVLDPHIGCIYGDSITVDRQLEIYQRLEAKGFAATNIILGVGSYTMQYNTRDTLGFAAKGAWFEVKSRDYVYDLQTGGNTKYEESVETYNIYKDPVTDDGTKKSLKGLLCVTKDDIGEYIVLEEMSPDEEAQGELQVIYEDGSFYNTTTLEEVRVEVKKK
jgi:nicotinamide phosphoribosyltransferase